MAVSHLGVTHPADLPPHLTSPTAAGSLRLFFSPGGEWGAFVPRGSHSLGEFDFVHRNYDSHELLPTTARSFRGFSPVFSPDYTMG
jgi:hypothetical protein